MDYTHDYTIHRFHGRPAPSLVLRAAHAHSAVPGGQNALLENALGPPGTAECACILPTRPSLMRLCGPIETKMAVVRENDEFPRTHGFY
jgi:hypothetical protein